MIVDQTIKPDLRVALGSALDQCREAVADYRAGLLDDDEVRHALFHAGLVHWHHEVWLLDLRGERWWRYDGVGLGAGCEAWMGPGAVRLRHAVDDLAAGHGIASQESLEGKA